MRRELERRRMLEHEERMRRPVSELFPRPKEFSRVMSCKGCGSDFTWTPKQGRVSVFCTSECKSRFYERKRVA